MRIMTVAAIAAAGAAGVAIAATSENRPASVPARPAHSSSWAGCARPYTAQSPFNTPIAPGAAVSPLNARYIASLDPAGAKLSSDPTQYTWGVFVAGSRTPRKRVTFSGWYSRITSGGRRIDNIRQRGQQSALVPIPAGTAPSDGEDGNVVVVNPQTGQEWNMSRFRAVGDGFEVSNLALYNVRWSGVPPRDRSGGSLWVNGAGLPLLGGLVRACEIRRGSIPHALSFAYPATTAQHVWPATKSDGTDPVGQGMPEGTRLQLDPRLTPAQIRAWGCSGACLTIARALQRYGMYVLNGSGRPKLMVEDDRTAHWGGLVSSATVAPIPLSAFRALAPARR